MASQLPVVFSRPQPPARRVSRPGRLSPASQRTLAVGGTAAVGVGMLTFIARRWLMPMLARRVGRALTARVRRNAPVHAGEDHSAASSTIGIEQTIWIRRIIIRR